MTLAAQNCQIQHCNTNTNGQEGFSDLDRMDTPNVSVFGEVVFWVGKDNFSVFATKSDAMF